MCNCTDVYCFCKKINLFDPKKNKHFFVRKMYFSINHSSFLKFLVQNWFQYGLLFTSFGIYYAEFLFFKLKNVLLSLKCIQIIENTEKYITTLDKFRLLKLKNYINKHIKRTNSENLQIENVIQVEKEMIQI